MRSLVRPHWPPIDLDCGLLLFAVVILCWSRTHCVANETAQSVPPSVDRSPKQTEYSSPNVIIVLTDDQGWGDLSCHGNTNLTTRHLDLLADEGARFDRFFVCPVCAPTRAELLTGRFHLRTGVTGVSLGKERLNLDEWTIVQDFKASGYATGCFGKWHNGTQYPYHPIARGFDEFYGFCSGHWGDYFSPPLDHNGSPVRGQGYIVDDCTDRALDFIDKHAEGKFFLYLPLPTPHTPMQVPDEYWQRLKDRPLGLKGRRETEVDSQFTRAALAMVENIDDNVGRVLAKLEELAITEKTLVLFFSDNGPNNDRWNGDMRGRKGSTDEGGVRSPLFIRWPGRIRPGRCITQICSVVDLYPTLIELAGIRSLNSQPLDGTSLVAWLDGQEPHSTDRVIASHWNGQVSLRTQQYRMDARGRLYDMLADPGQDKDLADLYPALTIELQRKKDDWFQQFSVNPLGPDERPFTVGHPDFSYTELPARDGWAEGLVRRSSAAPNCSYFTNWTDSQDAIEWHVEILEAGQFAVQLHYASTEACVGTEVRLTFHGNFVQRPLRDANDPPPRGSENDRVPRTSESYMKEFSPMDLGVIQLPKAKGKLKLTLPAGLPIEIEPITNSHSSGIEVSMLTLTRVP